MEALAWYKGASERGAEHLSLLTKDLPVGGCLDFGAEVSPLHGEPLVPKAPLSLPWEVEVLAQHLVWWQTRVGAKGAAPRRAAPWLRLDASPHTGNETLVQPTKCTNI